jgi:hypothetical protein
MEVLRFKCSQCDELHEGLPDLVFAAPVYYDQIPVPERAERARLTSELCVIDDRHFFVRAALPIPIRDAKATFSWGVWVSLSERSFARYVELQGSAPAAGGDPCFGWLSNQLPRYPDTLSLKAHLHLQPDGRRGLLELEPTDHPLAVHQRDGIKLLDLLAIVEGELHARQALAPRSG